MSDKEYNQILKDYWLYMKNLLCYTEVEVTDKDNGKKTCST